MSTPDERALMKLFKSMTHEDRKTLLDFARELPDEGPGKALYEGTLPEYAADLLPWEELTEDTRQFWRKNARERAKMRKP
jgi:hypothetical protein